MTGVCKTPCLAPARSGPLFILRRQFLSFFPSGFLVKNVLLV